MNTCTAAAIMFHVKAIHNANQKRSTGTKVCTNQIETETPSDMKRTRKRTKIRQTRISYHMETNLNKAGKSKGLG